MARLFTRLTDIQYVANTAGAIYTNAASTTSYIKSFVLYNNNTSTETVKLYNVPDSAASVGTAGDANQFAEIALAAKETLMFDLPYPITIIDENDTIQAVTTTASKVTVQVLGDKDA
jgi:hypothetical protein